MLSKIIRSIKRRTFMRDAWKHLFVTKRLFRLLNIFLPFVKINSGKIVFSSFYGGNYNCNPKYIAEELIMEGVDCELVWLLDRKKASGMTDFPSAVRIVDYLSLRAFFELASAGIWIDNCRKEFHPRKRKNQYYIQTWHGNIGLKKIEKEAGFLSPWYVKTAKGDALVTDFCISNGRFHTRIYREAFWYPDSVQVWEYGSPRNDSLVNNTDFGFVRKKLHLDENTNVVLYAPTFREDHSFDAYTVDYEKIIAALENRHGGKWIFLVRLHPNLVLHGDQLKIRDGIINVTMYPDVQELLGITDVLISDYSSVMFDFMFTRRPCFIYAADYDRYRKQRDVHFSLHELPFPIAENNDQLIMNLMSFDSAKYNRLIDGFIEHIGCFEYGNACQLTVGKIRELIGNW